MIPFRFTFEPGISLYKQVVHAAKKVVISGHMRPRDPFPSVRALSRALKINPNTAHKIVTHLVSEGLIEVRPGLGTEQLVVEAKRLSLDLDEVTDAVARDWGRLEYRVEGTAAVATTRRKE